MPYSTQDIQDAVDDYNAVVAAYRDNRATDDEVEGALDDVKNVCRIVYFDSDGNFDQAKYAANAAQGNIVEWKNQSLIISLEDRDRPNQMIDYTI
ncbi:hypothetical protein AWB71_05278 [Caballeronia peredens]|nr:hypothetical protein AWB71_05278 [Caballeronia peredens]